HKGCNCSETGCINEISIVIENMDIYENYPDGFSNGYAKLLYINCARFSDSSVNNPCHFDCVFSGRTWLKLRGSNRIEFKVSNNHTFVLRIWKRSSCLKLNPYKDLGLSQG